MIQGRNITWILPLVILITSPLWSIPVSRFLTPRGNFDPQPIQAPRQTVHRFNLEKIKITQTQDDRKTSLIIADSAQTTKDPNVFIMHKVNADIFSESAKPTSITAEKGAYNTATENLQLNDNVVVRKEGQTLFTDKLFYDNKKRTVHCPGKIKLEADGVTINGGSLDYDIDQQNYVIGNRVHVFFDSFPSHKPSL
ncbi:MAG: LPS export ABC transporter periplasmic protein LptC [Deltaproteobacteria bacterium]|nr:MAG: LPS export ABC transporter periplasmic protein LptC [Deltaproteobacteria bacterium]PIE73309.1 MAG: LPS export ABC transporter periplasmic protein LptC [Deltaproteobacteria bacterium]